jgi:hypothetical protein
MPAYFALGFVALVGAIYALRGLSRADPAALARVLRYLAIAVALVGLGLLVLGGRIGLLMMLASLGYLVWRRWQAGRPFPGPGGGAGQAGGQTRGGGQSSSVDTAYLYVSLDHATSAVDGHVKQGRFQGRRLAELSRAELLVLLDEVRRADREGVPVLEAYLDRIHGPDWRSAEAPGDAGTAERPRPGRVTMPRQEALAMLGLGADATEEQIREAHHRLMLKLHPDHGGSDYLAARLNEARDVLLGA